MPSFASTGPSIADTVIYVAGGDRYLRAIDIGNGQELWKFGTDGVIRIPPIIHDVIVITDDKWNIYALK